MTKKVRVGIIGCGGICDGKHLPQLVTMDNLEIVALCDIIEDRAIEIKEKYKLDSAVIYTDYKALLKDKTIEVVHVLTPNRSHSIITVDALEAGKHVMCEKPMAKTYSEAKKMLEASKRTGKKLTIGYQTRWRNDYRYLKKCCEDGELGNIYYARAIALRRRAVPTWGVFLNEYEQGGGPLIDIGTHSLDITLWLMNNYEPEIAVGTTFKKLSDQKDSANAWGDWDTEKFTVEDSAFGFVKMKNGAVVSVESSWALNIADPMETTTLLCGDKGGADTLNHHLKLNYVKNGRQVIENPDFSVGGVAFFDGNEENPSFAEIAAFYDAVINDHDVPTKPEQALVVTQILEGIYESARTGKPVYFE